jgi:hypothetical protein
MNYLALAIAYIGQSRYTVSMTLNQSETHGSETMTTTQLSGGHIEGAIRIDSCCWTDGDFDNLIIEFWQLPGSILRTEYNRRTTVHSSRFLPVDSFEFREMMKRAATA